MMVSTKGRYALRVVIDLAQQDSEGFVSLKEIAQRQGLSLKYLESIVSLLSRGGIVRSQRGKDGGYRLSRPPEDISVGEIVLLTEGRLAPVSCLEAGAHHCDKSDTCLTYPMWASLDSLIDGYLGSVSIRDIIERKIKFTDTKGDDNG